jgi:dienelactone hydrolase
VRITDIGYDVDGQEMVGRLAFDEYRVGPRPAVLLCHEGPGLDEHVKGRAVRLAGLGYVAFALDYHGEGRPLPREQAMARLDVFIADADLTRRFAQAGLELLLAQEQVDRARVAAIGYCFGGAMALELARSGADVQAVVGFHPGLSSPRPADPGAIEAAILMCCGAGEAADAPPGRGHLGESGVSRRGSRRRSRRRRRRAGRRRCRTSRGGCTR